MTVRDFKELVEDLVEYDKNGDMSKIEDISIVHMMTNNTNSRETNSNRFKKGVRGLYIKTTEECKLLNIEL